MGSEWEQDLIAICQAVEFAAPPSCTFAGTPLIASGQQDVESGAAVVNGEPTTELDRLRAALRVAIYAQCYVRHFTGVLKQPSAVHDSDFVPDPHFAKQLAEANQSRSGWDPGWEVGRIAVGRELQAKKGDRYRTVRAGHYAFNAGPGMSPRVGDRVSLQVLRESVELQPGIYFAFGETLGDEFDQADSVRFYFHLDPLGAPRLIELLSTVLNRLQIAFEFKCQIHREAFDRVDAAVLYIARRHFDVVYRLVMQCAVELHRHLRSAVPLFTKRIHAGIGVADDPAGNRSFGQNRCNLIVDALLDLRCLDHIDPPEFIAALKRQFEMNGLSFDRPYLNPGRVDMFDTARSSECAP